MCFLVPQNVGLEEACTFGVGWVSATQVLEQRLFKDVGEGGKGLKDGDAVSWVEFFLFMALNWGMVDAAAAAICVVLMNNR